FMTVSRMLDERGHKVATHSWGTGVSLLQNIHSAFAAANTCILEVPPTSASCTRKFLAIATLCAMGLYYCPQQPGLGIQVTDKINQRHPFVPGSGQFTPTPGKTLLLAS